LSSSVVVRFFPLFKTLLGLLYPWCRLFNQHYVHYTGNHSLFLSQCFVHQPPCTFHHNISINTYIHEWSHFLLSIQQLQEKNPRAGILPASVMTAYCTYLVWSALMRYSFILISLLFLYPESLLFVPHLFSEPLEMKCSPFVDPSNPNSNFSIFVVSSPLRVIHFHKDRFSSLLY
jgi:hypothetical protein